MSVMDETSQSAMGPYVAVAAVGFASNARTAVCREALVVKVPGGDGGDGGGDGDRSSTTKDSLPCLGPLAKEKVCPKPGAAHSAPFQPSPYESVMSRVHVAPSVTANGTLEVYVAPPLSVVPSEQLRLQPTSPGYNPLEQVIVEDADVDSGEGEGDGGGGVGGEGDGDGGESNGSGGEGDGGCGLGEGVAMHRSTGSHCGGQATPRAEGRAFELR
jgi:hypothetical protein